MHIKVEKHQGIKMLYKLAFIQIIFFVGCMAAKKNIDYRNVKKIDVVFIKDSTQQNPKAITDEDNIKNLINCINKSRKTSVLKAHWNYKLNIIFKDTTVLVIGVSGRYIKKEGGWYKIKTDLEKYINK